MSTSDAPHLIESSMPLFGGPADGGWRRLPQDALRVVDINGVKYTVHAAVGESGPPELWFALTEEAWLAIAFTEIAKRYSDCAEAGELCDLDS